MSSQDRPAGESPLSHYGTCLTAYRGEGTLVLDDGQQAGCAFEAGQLADGSVLLLCAFLEPIPFLVRGEARRFEGRTSEGYPVTGEGLTEITYLPDTPHDRVVGVWAACRVNELHVQIGPPQGAGQLVRFGVTNFAFTGTEPFKVGAKSVLVLPLTLASPAGPLDVRIEPVARSSEVINRVRTLQGVDVTCEVAAGAVADQDFPRVREAMDDLCYLLSVAHEEQAREGEQLETGPCGVGRAQPAAHVAQELLACLRPQPRQQRPQRRARHPLQHGVVIFEHVEVGGVPGVHREAQVEEPLDVPAQGLHAPGLEADPRQRLSRATSSTAFCAGVSMWSGACTARVPPGPTMPAIRGSSVSWSGTHCKAALLTNRSTGSPGCHAAMSSRTKRSRSGIASA